MDRGASSVVGTILMTGIVITAMTVAGVAMLDRTYGGAERAPVGAVDVTTHDGTVAVTYCGGEPLASDGLVVVLRGADETRRVGFSEGEWATGGGATGSFSPGMTWRFENATVGALAEDDVAVVHRPSNSVLDTTKCGGPETTPATSTTTTTTTTSTTTTTTGDEVADPGAAYTDVNGNGVYDTGDHRVNAGNLADGYSSNEALVVPKSVSVDVQAGTTISADGILVRGTITSSEKTGKVTLDSNGENSRSTAEPSERPGRRLTFASRVAGGTSRFGRPTSVLSGRTPD